MAEDNKKLADVQKELGLDIYKAVSKNLESLHASGKISSSLSPNNAAKELSEYAVQRVRDYWVDRDEVRRTPQR